MAETRRKLRTDFNPAQVVSLSFLSLIAVGCFLLVMPAAAVDGRLSLLDALFMSTSAVCVTGLSTVSVGSDLTLFGQGVILLLMQLGGLGIMTFSLFFIVFGRKASLFSHLSVWKLTKQKDTHGVLTAALFVLCMTFTFELIGALFLIPFFSGLGIQNPVFTGIFHAVSGFCNAGFTLFDSSLTLFNGKPFFLGVMMSLVVLGGLGFIVIDELRSFFYARYKGHAFRLSLHSRIALSISGMLLLGGGVLFWILEAGNQLQGMPAWKQALNGLFLSVTARTAGFNTLDTSMLSHPTLFSLIFLMFIGGTPASTAGGIKVTTLAVLAALFWQSARGGENTNLGNRQIARPILRRAFLLFLVSIMLITLGVLGLLISESYGVSRDFVRGNFMDVLFEGVSAFGTVGLSTGITPDLKSSSKLIVILMMFTGRIGPLTLALAVLLQRKTTHIEYAEEDILVG